MLVIFAAVSCSAPAAGIGGADHRAAGPEIVPSIEAKPMLVPVSGDLIFVEFFAIT